MGSRTAWQPLVMDQQWPARVFDVNCTACPRLHAFHEQNRQKFPDHFNGPVPPFGPVNAELLIVGLASSPSTLFAPLDHQKARADPGTLGEVI